MARPARRPRPARGPHDQDALARHVGGQVIPGRGQRLLPPDAEPVREQDLLPLPDELRLRGEARPRQAALQWDVRWFRASRARRAGSATAQRCLLRARSPATGPGARQSSEYGFGGSIGWPSLIRPGLNGARSTLPPGAPMISPAIASPTAGAILKPMPENLAATIRPSRPGSRPSSGRASGVMSYTPVTPRAMPASSSAGTRHEAASTSGARSSEVAAAAASGSAPRWPAKEPTSVITFPASGRKEVWVV